MLQKLTKVYGLFNSLLLVVMQHLTDIHCGTQKIRKIEEFFKSVFSKNNVERAQIAQYVAFWYNSEIIICNQNKSSQFI